MSFCDILGIGHPLLDMTVHDPTLHQIHGFGSNETCLVEPSHPIYQDVASRNPVYTAGGATQNTIRIVNWLFRSQIKAVFTGCIGQDWAAEFLRTAIARDGVDARYVVNNLIPTGKCACLIKDDQRSLITTLGAAKHIPKGTILSLAENPDIGTPRFVYSAAFLCTHPEGSELAELFRLLRLRGSITVTNISAAFIPSVSEFLERLMAMVSESLFLFGNEMEFDSLLNALGLDHPSELLDVMPEGAHVIRTAGSNDTFVYSKKNRSLRFSVPPLDELGPDLIFDTTGAGDAFVGGFISGLLKGYSLESCVQLAHSTAAIIIREDGVRCQLPPPVFKD